VRDGIPSLDEDETDSNPFPEIPAWEFVSRIYDSKVTIEFPEDGEARLVVTVGDPSDGPYQSVSFDIEYEDIIKLGQRHIAPLAAWIDREKARERDSRIRDEVAARMAADARPWVIQTSLNGARAMQVKVHRSSCGVVKQKRPEKLGENTFGGTHNGEELILVLSGVQKELTELVSARLVEAKLHQARRAAAGRVRDVAFDRRPLVLCKTCKPLGDATARLQAEVERLTDINTAKSEHELAVVDLMDHMRDLVWQEEQAHLDRHVRGTPQVAKEVSGG
jgi:hypothetical protein